MRRVLLAIILAVWATLNVADTVDPPLPALYSVTGVASDDSLNIRAHPDTQAAVIGTLAHDVTDIEVIALSREGKWALINAGERAGWVSARFLARQDLSTTSVGLPLGLTCFGTEPFWDITFQDNRSLIYATPEGTASHLIQSMQPRPDYIDLATVGLRFVWRSSDRDVTAHILPGQCSDGMSDRTYGLHYIDDLGPKVGCCSLN